MREEVLRRIHEVAELLKEAGFQRAGFINASCNLHVSIEKEGIVITLKGLGFHANNPMDIERFKRFSTARVE